MSRDLSTTLLSIKGKNIVTDYTTHGRHELDSSYKWSTRGAQRVSRSESENLDNVVSFGAAVYLLLARFFEDFFIYLIAQSEVLILEVIKERFDRGDEFHLFCQ